MPKVGCAVNTAAKPVRPTRSRNASKSGRAARHRRDEPTGEIGERVPVLAVEADIAAQPRRPLGQGPAAKRGEQRVEVALADLLPVEPAGDRQRHRQDGIAERVLARLFAALGHEVEEVALQIASGERGRPLGAVLEPVARVSAAESE